MFWMYLRSWVHAQNGSNQELDLTAFGCPLYGYSINKLLWTFQGSLRLYPRSKVDRALKSTSTTTSVFLSASRREKDPLDLWSYLVCEEAAQVALRMNATAAAAGSRPLIHQQPALVSECFSYILKQCCMGSHCMVDYDLSTHCGNYWICDGILHLEHVNEGDDHGSGLCWRAADALQDEMQLDEDNCCHDPQYLPSHLVRCAEIIPCWTSPTYRVTQMLDGAITSGDNIFQHYDKLSVLKLSHCTFNFTSPPFLCCRGLKFLWLDHCQDQAEINTDTGGTEENEQGIQRCFQRLWVLDMRYTRCDRILSTRMLGFMTQLRELNVIGVQQDWDMGQLHGWLPNIRRLRVTKSTVHCTSCSEEDLFSGMDKMELLDLSGNHTKKDGVTGISTSSNQLLQSVTVAEGCVGIQRFSFRGCAILKNLLLSGLFDDLRVLDLSGTAIKTLDLSAMTAQKLGELYLDDCEELCAILWPPEDKRKEHLQKLHVDTTCSAALMVPKEEKSMESSTTTANMMKTSSTSLSVIHGGRAPSEFNWSISVKDSRLVRSLVPLKEYIEQEVLVHLEISSPTVAFASGKGNEAVNSRSSIKQQHVLVKLDQPKGNSMYADVAVTFKDHLRMRASQGDGDAPMLTWVWICPRMPSLSALTCYTYVQDHQLKNIKSLQGGQVNRTGMAIPDTICHNACILHVHDCLFITSVPGPAPAALGSRWFYLQWCRVERCPMLEYVFTTIPLSRGGQGGSGDVAIFAYLDTFWASQLPKARFIWNWSRSLEHHINAEDSFRRLEFLHLDFCPRLIHVLPLSEKMVDRPSLGNLQTLEIVWCGDLRVIFPLYTDDAKSDQQQHKQQPTAIVRFPSLKRVHLHELPMLHGICGQWRVSAPVLVTIKIRGCWSLKHLPAVSSGRSKKVKCDCEKEWWDRLEWDGLDANHHPCLYKPTHSRYYKKAMLRTSVLR